MRLEPREHQSLALLVGYPALALAFAAVVCALLVMLTGASPFQVFGLMLKGALGTQFAFLETLTRATPLIFTGLAAAVAFRAKLWNIGAEAQLYMGAVMTVVLGTGLLPLPWPILWPVLMVSAMIGGALVLSVPTFLKTRFGVDEVVTTLLLNFIVLLFVSMLLEGILKDPMGLGWPQSKKIIADAQLPRLVQGKRLHLGFVVALLAALAVWIIDRKSALGYEMRAVGHNAKAAHFAGIPVNRVLAKTALLSGGLAGLAGWSEVTGLKGNLTLDLSPGFGYSGIVVAMLALLHPIGVVAAAIFVAAVFVGADAMSRTAGVPSYIAHVMVAVSLLAMVTAIMLTRYRLRWR
jgi:general nucleoside transport system permease protein